MLGLTKAKTLGVLMFALTACSQQTDVTTEKTPDAQAKQYESDFSIEYEKFTLDNGLDVIFHIDRSDPVTAVALTAHVGSSREVEGRTGFAHLFEHLLFLESENLGFGGLDAMSARIGGSGANGSTSRDRTNYYQTVPNDALEKMIWAEADKLGWFINTVTLNVLEKEKQVVKNEFRQGIGNVPYGHMYYVIDKNLYPEGHPYSWQIIGSLEDLQASTLDDVHEFFKRWYVPNNVSLVIAGDFDVEQAKAWVHKYFDEIPRGPAIPKMEKQPATLTQTKHLKHEDNFAQQPQFTMTWPGTYRYSKDSYALEYLTRLLADGKQAPLYKVLVDEQSLTSDITMYSYDSEIAGQVHLQVKAFESTNLNDVSAAIQQAFAKFEKDGISDKAMNRIRTQLEKSFYTSNAAAINKAFQLANFDLYTGDPGYINQHINYLINVTKDDVMRVYDTYIKGKHYISTSFVPKGQDALALAGSVTAEVPVEKIVAGAEATEFDLSKTDTYEKTPSTFDRSKEPPYGKPPVFNAPPVWESKLNNGIQIHGIENNELPLVAMEFVIEGGQLLEGMDNLGIASLTANMLNRGTTKRSKAEIEEAIELIGASLNITGGKTDITISANGLANHFDDLLGIISEVILMPAFDEKEFKQLKTETIERIKSIKSDPDSIASDVFAKLLYGTDSAYAYDPDGTIETVEAITLDDVKAFYQKAITPGNTYFNVVGNITQESVLPALATLNNEWKGGKVVVQPPTIGKEKASGKLYFYDVPGAKQSQIRAGNISLSANDENYLKAKTANYKLGSGGFASRLMQVLRSEKGYTYGVRGRFYGNPYTGIYMISTGVRSNVTLESMQDIISIVKNYSDTFTPEDLSGTQSFFVKSSARSFESLSNKLGLLSDVSLLGRQPSYIAKRNETLMQMTVEDMAQLSNEYMNLDNMVFLVVGDAETQLEGLESLGLGKPIMFE